MDGYASGEGSRKDLQGCARLLAKRLTRRLVFNMRSRETERFLVRQAQEKQNAGDFLSLSPSFFRICGAGSNRQKAHP